MIEQLFDFPDNVVAFVCSGRVTKAHYDGTLVPALRDALIAHDKVRLYYETATDFAGIDAGAVWEDFKVGMEHLTRWERIAVVTDVERIKLMVHFFSFLMPGETRLFSLADAARAREWVARSSERTREYTSRART